MLEAPLRKHYDRHLVDPVIQYLAPYIAPLQITVLAALTGLLFLPALLLGYKKTAILFLLLSGYCDTLDGSLARWQKSHSNLGSVVDIVSDRFVECLVVVSLFLLAPAQRGLASVLMLSSITLCITSFLVVGIFMQNQSYKSFHYSPGIMERAEAFAFFIVMVLVPEWFNGLAYLFTALVCLTAVIRLMQFAANEMSTEPL